MMPNPASSFPPSDQERLARLHELMEINGMSSMTQEELDEYSNLFAQSLRGKGNPISGVPV